jgi:cell division transport system permease protein
MRAQFILSEIAIGLRRNLTMTVAVVVTIAISLALFGAGLLIGKQVVLLKGFWYDKIEVSVFLCGQDSTEVASCAQGEVTTTQREVIRDDLDALPEVEEIFYESKREAYDRFRVQFKESAIVENVTPDQMPESYRIKLSDPEQFDVVRTGFDGRPGVEKVEDQRELLGPFFNALDRMQVFAFGVAVVQLIAAGLLIANTIRVAAFNRRRETGIMRLVGASNLYIQLPFVLEGAIAGLIGGLFAAVLLGFSKVFLLGRLTKNLQFATELGWLDVTQVIVFSVCFGVVLCSLASFLTLRRYLKI